MNRTVDTTTTLHLDAVGGLSLSSNGAPHHNSMTVCLASSLVCGRDNNSLKSHTMYRIVAYQSDPSNPTAYGVGLFKPAHAIHLNTPHVRSCTENLDFNSRGLVCRAVLASGLIGRSRNSKASEGRVCQTPTCISRRGAISKPTCFASQLSLPPALPVVLVPCRHISVARIIWRTVLRAQVPSLIANRAMLHPALAVNSPTGCTAGI